MAEDLLGVAPSRGRWRALLYGSGVAAVVAAALLVAVVVPRGHGEFAARGRAAVQRAEGVRAFCLDLAGPDGPRVTGAAASTKGSPARLRCPRTGALQFAYTLDAGPPRYLVVVGTDAAGRAHRYVPLARDGAEPLSPGAVDEPLPGSVRIGRDAASGVVRLAISFLDAPPSTAGATANAADRQSLDLEVVP